VLPAVAAPTPGNLLRVKDWSSLRISLERTACYGVCPVYEIEIKGDGSVTYCGKAFVKERGLRTKVISVESVRQLADRFGAADFFQLSGEYVADITDMPTTVISVAFDGRSKAVLDYAGAMAGIPEAVSELEDAIDTVTGADAWIGEVGMSGRNAGPSTKCS